MDFIKKITSKYQYRFVEVQIDSNLDDDLSKHGYSYNNNVVKVPVSLYSLIFSIGLVMLRREPTNRPKFVDFVYLLEYIKSGPNLLVMKSGIPETQARMSEELGVGISIQLTKHFFNISDSTINPILKAKSKTMDFECVSYNKQIINVEAKGTINKYTRSSQISDGMLKKDNSQANIKVISATLLEETGISNCIYQDPPIIPPDNPEYKINLMKADHYSRVFNLLGQKELSKYFYLVKQRIINNKNFRDFAHKEVLYEKLKDGSIQFEKSDMSYVGNVYRDSENTYQFIGFDKKLISIEDFLNFKDYSKEKRISFGRNKFHVTKDGVCLGYISRISELPEKFMKKIIAEVNKGNIRHVQEYTTMVDIDSMNHHAFDQYFEFLFKKLDLEFNKEVFYKGAWIDYVVTFKKTKYNIEIKKSSKKINLNDLVRTTSINMGINKIFITNQNLTDDASNFLKENKIEFIDRRRMKHILSDSSFFLSMFKK